MRLGIFLPNWVGDVVMATPALRALRRHFGQQATLVGIMRPYVADVLCGTTWLDERLFFDPHSKDSSIGSWSLVRQLRQQSFDAVVLFTHSRRSALLAWAGGVPRRIGYVRYGRAPLLTHRLQPPRNDNNRPADVSMVDYYLNLAYALGATPESPRLELTTTLADERNADFVWNKLKLHDGKQVVVFNSSGAYGAAKLWPATHFADLARRVVTRLDHDVLVLCGPSERHIAADIVRQAAHPRVASLAEESLSIGLSKACIRRSRLLVTTDSGPRHFAVAFGVPLVGLYGPTIPIWGENPTARETSLLHPLDCSDCRQRTCPLGHHRCMQELTPEKVYRAVAAELGVQRVTAA